MVERYHGRQPDAIEDTLTEVAREGTRRMLAQVLIAEAEAFITCGMTNPDGSNRHWRLSDAQRHRS